ncbi:hypothetical protein GCM10010357_22490 [Streptomyces luteireticuli]|uniref:Uncharacterized protein n=1 Tax=Streptomyces luteireticuli TaxID=173858 RepID=A0ABN0YMF4_9ACTN
MNTPTPPPTYPPGTWLVDIRTNKLGRCMDKCGPHIQLRAPQGGREWDAPPNALRPAHADELHREGIASC